MKSFQLKLFFLFLCMHLFARHSRREAIGGRRRRRRLATPLLEQIKEMLMRWFRHIFIASAVNGFWCNYQKESLSLLI